MKKCLVIFCLMAAARLAAQDFQASAVVDSLGCNKFYFVGQAHGNKANTIIEQQLLFALNKKDSVRYDVLEYAQSAAFLINQYLESGQDAFLSIIDKNANFSFIKAVKEYNDELPPNQRISFYGIDYERKYTQIALELILNYSQMSSYRPMHKLLTDVVTSEDDMVRANMLQLQQYMAANEEASRQALGKYYIDVLLIANAIYGFDMPQGRDSKMFENFKRLYNELSRNEASPKFFASFGFGHINPDNINGIAMQLLHNYSSPVKDSVSIAGAQYFNSQFGEHAVKKSSDGTLEFLCKSAAVKKLASQGDKAAESITFLSGNQLKDIGCNQNIIYLSGLIVVRNFGATNSWTWE